MGYKRAKRRFVENNLVKDGEENTWEETPWCEGS